MSLPQFDPLFPLGDIQLPPSDLLIDKIRSKYSWNARSTTRLDNLDETFARKSEGLKIAFAEIDGLMAGMTYMDKRSNESVGDLSMSPSQICNLGEPVAIPSRQPPYPPLSQTEASCYPDIILDDDLAGEAGQATGIKIPKRSSPNLPPVVASLATQWTALRKLRIETERHHQRFLQLTKGTDDVVLENLRNHYPTAKKVRKQGMLLMRQILDDYRPNKIEDIFAFTSLSYAMAKRLHAKGKIDEASILADFNVCCDAISDEVSRSSFMALASELWPESLNHGLGTSSPMSSTEALQNDAQYDGHESRQHPTGYNQKLFNGQRAPVNGEARNANTAQPNSGMFGPELGHNNPLFGKNVPVLLYNSHDSDNYAACRPMEYWGPMVSDEQHRPVNMPSSLSIGMGLEDDFGPFLHDFPPPIEYWTPSVGPGVTQGSPDTGFPPKETPEPGFELRLSKVFLVVLCFCHEVKYLVDIFSGLSFTSKHESTKMYQTQRQAIQRFHNSMSRSFFEPLRAANKPAHPHFAALLSVTETLTELGYFKSLAEIKHYMRTVGLMALFPPGEVQERFMRWVAGDGRSELHASPYAAHVAVVGGKRKASTDHYDGFEEPMGNRGKQPRVEMTKCKFPACNAFFETEDARQKHENTGHKKARGYSCRFKLCKYTTTRKDRLEKHLLTPHPDAPVLAEII